VYKRFFKRFIDFFAALLGLILTSPILLIVSVGLFFANKGAGVFFFQERPGKNSKIFRIVKFKTMTDEKDNYGELLPASQRITKIGRFIRSTSIDELPQLFNVLKGDMSLIGPRPLLVQYLPLYSQEQARRHEVRPGITGWAQVNGRNTISWKKKFEYDVWYVDHVSFITDLRIISLTLKKVIQRADINSANSVTMPTFNGKN
jgi:lipopolysaccharide/colanic/teichoic acid biosynthesis glycosyltransferase